MQPPTEVFDADERARLAPYVTNVDRQVFALTNLPEVVKGALFARYSRSPKSLRRLLLDEFLADLPPAAAATGPHEPDRAARLYERVFVEYGDDSVAQLGGAHVAVEQVSNLMTKVLEWGRLASYLEQSTRYMRYDDRPGGRYRYHRDADVMATPHAAAYERELDAVFAIYSALFDPVMEWARARFPQDELTSDVAYRNTITAKACDVLRGLLPAAVTSNVGIFASGQSYEQLLLRLRSHDLAEARHVGDLLLAELRQVIPSFVTRVDRPDRGGVWSDYLAATRAETRAIAAELLAEDDEHDVPEVRLVDHSPDAEETLLVGMLHPYTHLAEHQLREQVARMGTEDRERVVRAYVGERRNRRHKPGRALERVWYRFEVCSDYGAFRDLQRHRMMTVEWQELSPRHGAVVPPEVEEAGVRGRFDEALDRQAQLWSLLHPDLPRQSQYAVGFAWKLRYTMQMNARAAMQMLELRSTPQGHPSYRRVARDMHRLIAEQAGHRAVAAMLSFVDHGDSGLERLEAERAADARRAARA